MKIELVLVKKEEKEILKKLIEKYQRELLIEDFGEYKYLDSYWNDDKRFSCFIKVNGKLIGFVLVNDYLLVNKEGKSVAEFFIKKEFRKKGIGKIAAFRIFDLFKGNWEVRQMEENISGQNFWRKVIGEYTKNDYREIFLNNQYWCGPVQIFKN